VFTKKVPVQSNRDKSPSIISGQVGLITAEDEMGAEINMNLPPLLASYMRNKS